MYQKVLISLFVLSFCAIISPINKYKARKKMNDISISNSTALIMLILFSLALIFGVIYLVLEYIKTQRNKEKTETTENTIIFALKGQTNTVNDSVATEWTMLTSEDEFLAWEAELKKANDEWNYRTKGAMSTRYLDIQKYSAEQAGNLSIGELEGMPLDMFTFLQSQVKINLIKNYPK
jgi:hypothetical protein